MTSLVDESALSTVVSDIAAELEVAHVPGLELAVVRDGKTVFAGGVGVRGVFDPAPVSATTLFHHGSCGKAYTGLLAVLLAADGVVELDVPVRRYVPELRLPDPVIAERVTLRDLLSHRSGFGRNDLAWIVNPGWSPEDVVARLEHLPLVGDLRAQWSYSNFGYALAGFALGRAAGTSWAAEMHERVLGPLGMSRTRLTAAGMAEDPDHATPHVVRDEVPRATVFRLLNGIAPAGEVVSCAEDSVRWLMAQLGEGPLSAELVRQPQTPSMLVPSGVSPFPEMEFVGYGLGWLAGRYRGRPLVWHNGGVDGFATQTLLLPDDRIGILASANVFPGNTSLAVVLGIADELLGRGGDEPSWFERLRAAESAAEAVPEQPSEAAPTSPTAVKPHAHDLAAYAGSYDNHGWGRLTVAVGDSGLRVWIGEYEMEAAHRHFETWRLYYAPLDGEGTVTFATDASGTVCAADIAFESVPEPVRFHGQ
ncbi:MAG TPA: serine hydrolase [Mycobacteriales bacterium]|nr:serine hydrolase [Mycobacteriales bacterium]